MSGGDFELQDVAVPDPVMISMGLIRFLWAAVVRAKKMTQCPSMPYPF